MMKMNKNLIEDQGNVAMYFVFCNVLPPCEGSIEPKII
jgi:hypothetical protein